ncbi:MAG: ATP-dependent helicase C-terminal domain-containing protein [Opitutales bacterium]|nr:ATP-dependent helicase C-terminal domain-containing protein [Opitutales bacterium]
MVLSVQELPVVKEFSKFEKNWSQTNNFVLQAPTGSGKSLGLPWSLLHSKLLDGQVLIVQPRRIAAVSLARTLSGILNSEVGESVGYQIRFDNKSNGYTKIIYVTDGILFRLLESDPTLSRVSLVIFDEFHERTLKMDASLALLKKVQEGVRPNLKLLITSATIDLDKAAEFLSDCVKLSISGRTFPVDIKYSNNVENLVIWKQIEREAKKGMSAHPGDLLIFVDGVANIRKVIREIQLQKWSNGCLVLGLFGDMPKDQQDRVFEQTTARKIIVATNIAETSLTIPGVRIVIDSGISKVMQYDSLRNINSLLPQKISQSSANQRSGRAGRLSPGVCIRLWGEAEHRDRKEYQEPEIKRLDLSELCLGLLSRGLMPEDLDWYDPPSCAPWRKARDQLVDLSLLDPSGRITTKGLAIAQVPLQPRLSLALDHAASINCLSELAIILSIAESRSPFSDEFIKSQKDANPDCTSDLGLLLESYFFTRNNNISIDFGRTHGINLKRLHECERVARQYCSYYNQPFNPQHPHHEEIAKILLHLFPDNVVRCKSQGRKLYENAKGSHFFASPHSIVGDIEWAFPLIVTEKFFKGRVQTQMDLLSEIKEEWIVDALPLGAKITRKSYLDPDTRKVLVESFIPFGVHKLNLKREYDPNEEDIAQAYVQSILKGDLSLKNWTGKVDQLLERLNFLEVTYSDLGLKSLDSVDMQMILEQICLGKKSWKEIKNADVLPAFSEYLSNETIQLMNYHAPTHILMGNKSRSVALHYSGTTVTMKIKLQELYDVDEHPHLLSGNLPIIVEILAPNGRHIQRTSNIIDFWESSYVAIKKELAGRYPKHEWR